MFGIKDGFDIVIGNPPYISAPAQIADKGLNLLRQKLVDSNRFKSLYQKWDVYIVFIELGLQLCRQKGILSMIVPFPLTNQLYAKVLRKMLTEECDMFELCDLNGTKIFENATVSNCIPFVKKTSTKGKTWISNINENFAIHRVFEQKHSELVQDEKTYVWNVTQENRETNRHADMHVLGDYCYISKGMVLNSDENAKSDKFVKADLISETKDKIHCKQYIEGKDLDLYEIKRVRYLEYGTERSPAKLSRPTFEELYTNKKLLINSLGELKCTIDLRAEFYCEQQVRMALLWDDLMNVDNKCITSSIKKFSTLSRIEMEKLSKTVDLRYLLGVMNSRYASVLLTNIRGGDYHIVPEHIRNIPIPLATPGQQKPIIDLVDKILAAKSADNTADTSEMERKIDELVYKLYNLTEEEIAIVEENR
ncbi:MAG: Eco57I restriction-modification methylase domain-containing protein [Treponema sp.]|nr:Eco57I restriction-modification methylase domain-containing protein [Treponema sp.]